MLNRNSIACETVADARKASLAEDGSLLLAATPEAHLLNLAESDLAELESALEDTRVLSS